MRYDGNPNIEFIDIGSYGNWGEWHTPHPVDITIRKRIIDMYVNDFTKTPLVMMTDDPEALSYAVSKGTGMRRDGIGSKWNVNAWADSLEYPKSIISEVWKSAPIVFEWYFDYNYLQNCNHCSFEAGFQFMLDNHVTYINDNINRVPDSIFYQLHVLGEKSGYRFVMNEISHQTEVRPGDSLSLTMLWSNIGIAPLYHEYFLTISLIDTNGNAVFSQPLRANIKQWLPGNYRVCENICIPATLPPAKYTIGIALVNAKTHQPDIRLPINALEKNGIYLVSGVKIK
jgi:hypothetical protein